MARQTIRSVILKSVLALSIAPVSLLWAEAFTRILMPQNVDSRMNIYALDPEIGYKYKPYAKTFEEGKEYNALYETNSRGLRDREYGDKKKGVIRVLLVGDSFCVSHGLPIESSLSRQLENSLQRAADADQKPVRFEVVNAAAGGYSPYNYWKAYRRWSPVFRPDVVLVGLSPDDYDCSNEVRRYLVEDGDLSVATEERRPAAGVGRHVRSARKWLSWNSEFYVLMRNYFYYNDFVGKISLWMQAKGTAQNEQFQQYVVPQSEGMRRAWSKTFGYLQRLKKDAGADGVALVVMPLPLREEVDERRRQPVIQASKLRADQIDMDQPLRQILEFCRKEGIPALTPREAIRARHARAPCYFVYDGHLVSEGTRVVAETASEQWRASGLPPWDVNTVVP